MKNKREKSDPSIVDDMSRQAATPAATLSTL
jgi:hypothetical protein